MERTGGSWYLEEETGLILSIPDGADSPVIVASIGGSTTPITPKPLKETLANAQLIITAPKLYEALKGLEPTLISMSDGTTITHPTMMGIAINALQALAKVEGK